MTRTILITGANNGIGLAMTKALLEMDDRVTAVRSRGDMQPYINLVETSRNNRKVIA